MYGWVVEVFSYCVGLYIDNYCRLDMYEGNVFELASDGVMSIGICI